MKILVAGSCGKRDDENQKIQFKSAGRAIGAELARRGDTIYLGIPDWDYFIKDIGVVRYIVQGASEIIGEHHIVLYVPATIEPKRNDLTPGDTDTLQKLREYENIKLELREVIRRKSTVEAQIFTNFNEVDGVILICGSKGTLNIGYTAHAMKKPLITVNASNGSAQEIYNDFLCNELSEKYSRKIIPNPRILNTWWYSEDKLKSDEKNVQKQIEYAHKTVELLHKLYGIQIKEDRNTKATLASTLIISPLLALLWVGLFVYWEIIVKYIKTGVLFFILLFIAALVGTGIRTLVTQREESNLLTLSTFLTDCALSLLVAFGFALIYLIGGISFTGKVVTLDSTSENFSTIALSMSLLGLAAGALLPTRQLFERLGEYIEGEKSNESQNTK